MTKVKAQYKKQLADQEDYSKHTIYDGADAKDTTYQDPDSSLVPICEYLEIKHSCVCMLSSG